jgi:LacI family transcriptional regulator
MTDKKVKQIKLDDLAAKLGVSKVTISKALRDHPDISPATTLRVKKLADKLGYMPNYMAKNLSARRSNIIGLVVPKIAHHFFGSVIESVYNATFENNYETVLTVSQELAERERKHILSLLSMRVDGIIISITQETKDFSIFERVNKQNIPLVFIDRVPNLENAFSVTVDDRKGAFIATEHFINNGIRNIGHIGGYSHVNIGKARYDGFCEAMNKYQIPINKDWVIEGGFGEEDGYQGFKRMFHNQPLPQCILAVTYPVALGMYEAALELNVKIPEDIQVTCFGNNMYKHNIPSIFNFVHQPTKALGEEAVNLLLNMINNPTEVKVKNIVLETSFLLHGDRKLSGIVA